MRDRTTTEQRPRDRKRTAQAKAATLTRRQQRAAKYGNATTRGR